MRDRLRYTDMEKPTPSYLSSKARLSPARTVMPPQRHEGIGNALRAAYEPRNYGLPEDMARLLDQMDGKRRG